MRLKGQIVKLQKLSICKCGFPLLHESIAIGTEYEVVPSDREQATLVCGGCGSHVPFDGVWTKNRDNDDGGYLPKEIFGL